MLATQRRELILAEVERAGGVRVSELAELFGVSDMTVRRDLEQLELHGWLRKVHGGAVLATSSTEEPGFEAKSALQQPAKRAIAARAATLVEPNTAIALSAGTTTWMLARSLQGSTAHLSVVTNSTTVADILSAGGGQPAASTSSSPAASRTPSAALVGPIADRAIASLHVDRLFLGVHGMDSRGRVHHPEPRGGADQPGLDRQRPPGGDPGGLDEVGHRRTRRLRSRCPSPTC